MKKSIFSKYALTAFAIGVIVTSCKKDDDNPTPNPEPEQVVIPRLAIVASDVNATPGQNAPNGAPSVNNGTTHLLIIDDATKAQTDFDVIGNPNAVKTHDALFQIHYNEATKTIGGYVYGRAAAQAPDGLGGAGAQFYNVEGIKLTHLNNLQSGFGLAGVAGKYSYMAGSNDVITVFQRNGNQVIKTDTNLNLEKDGIYASG